MLRESTKPFKKCSAAAHAANADEVADDEPDTTGTNPQDPDEQEGSSQDADSNPLLRQRSEVLFGFDGRFSPATRSFSCLFVLRRGRIIELSALKIAENENLDIEDAMVVAWTCAGISTPTTRSSSQHTVFSSAHLRHGSLLTLKRYMFFTLHGSHCSRGTDQRR